MQKLATIKHISSEEIQVLGALFERSKLRKGYLLAKPRQRLHSLYFIETGMIRAYFNFEFDEKTIWLAGKNRFIIPFGFITGEDAQLYVESIQDSIVYELDLRSLESSQKYQQVVNRLLLEVYDESLSQSILYNKMLHISRSDLRYAYYLQHIGDLSMGASNIVLASFLSLSERQYGRVKKGNKKL